MLVLAKIKQLEFGINRTNIRSDGGATTVGLDDDEMKGGCRYGGVMVCIHSKTWKRPCKQSNQHFNCHNSIRSTNS